MTTHDTRPDGLDAPAEPGVLARRSLPDASVDPLLRAADPVAAAEEHVAATALRMLVSSAPFDDATLDSATHDVPVESTASGAPTGPKLPETVATAGSGGSSASVVRPGSARASRTPVNSASSPSAPAASRRVLSHISSSRRPSPGRT